MAETGGNSTSTAPILEKFHPKCGNGVTLSEDRRIASGDSYSALRIAFSNEPILNGLKFSVKILLKGSAWDLGIGMTIKSPDCKPLPFSWNDISSSDKYWYVLIRNRDCLLYHKWQKIKYWVLDRSAGNTVSCAVSENGELHVYHNGRDVGVVWEGLPTDQPLWGFVLLRGHWAVKASCIIPKGHPQDYAGNTFHFVERLPEGLICAVCQALAHNPVQANCCGKIYCTRCIERWKNRSNSCPTCRSTEQSDPPFSTFLDKRAYQDIQSLSVHCPNMCEKNMELYEVEDHLTLDNGCPLHVVDCSNKCGDGVFRSYIDEHMKFTCRLRKEKCLYCSLESTHDHIRGIHFEVCPKYPISCPNHCDAQNVTRSTVQAHRKECPLEQVECGYKQFGCTVVLPRKDIAEHLKTSVETHLQMTPSRVEEMEVRLQKQEVRLQKQEERLHYQEMDHRLQEALFKELKTRLKDVEETAEKDRQRMNEAIALGMKQMDDRAKEQEMLLKQERAERQLIEARLQEMEATLARLLAKLE